MQPQSEDARQPPAVYVMQLQTSYAMQPTTDAMYCLLDRPTWCNRKVDAPCGHQLETPWNYHPVAPCDRQLETQRCHKVWQTSQMVLRFGSEFRKRETLPRFWPNFEPELGERDVFFCEGTAIQRFSGTLSLFHPSCHSAGYCRRGFSMIPIPITQVDIGF